MSKAKTKTPNTTEEAIGRIIIAAWFKALPESSGTIQPIDANELSAAFSNILDVKCVAVIDRSDLVHIPVPYPPATTRGELITYLHEQYNLSLATGTPGQKNPFNPNNTKKHKGTPRTFAEDLGDATLFGCGR